MKIFKILAKAAVLPLILILKVLCVLAMLLTHVSTYVVSPLILFILGCGIYCVVKTRWTDAAILFVMETVVIGCLFGAMWVTDMAEDFSNSLIRFIHS